MTRPAVSILLPVRDEGRFLGETLASLSAQTYADFEAIVVDDGSRDASAAIAEAHARDDSRFRVVRAQRAGMVAALERGRAEAEGAFIARMDGDDVAMPGRLETQLEALESEGLTACGGRIAYFPRRLVGDGGRRYERWINGLVTPEAAALDVFVECPLPHPALVVRADALAAAGGYRDCGWPEDYDLVLGLWRRGARFRNVEEVVLRWREHPDRASRTDPVFAQGAFVSCKVDHLRRSLLVGWESVVVWGAGPVGKAFARELTKHGTAVAGFVDVDPRKIGRRLYGAPVVGVEAAARFACSFALGAVAREEGRQQVRDVAAAQGRREGVDFIAVA